MGATTPTTVWALDLTRASRSADAAAFANDALRVLSIQLVVQVLYHCGDGRVGALLSHEFLELALYLLLGVAFYWFVVARVVRIT